MSFNFKKLCGYHIGMPKQLHKPVNYVLAANGVKEVRSNEIGKVIVTPKRIVGLDEVTEGFSMKLPKIPMKVLYQIIAFFKEVNQLHHAEAIVQVFWNRNKKEYFIHCPPQKVSGTAANFERDTELEQKHLLVADIHSHNTMAAFFSGTDDQDEKETRLFGVIGKIDDPMPTIKFRANAGNSSTDMPLEDVFNLEAGFPKGWLGKLTVEESFTGAGFSQSAQPLLWNDPFVNKPAAKDPGDTPEHDAEEMFKLAKQSLSPEGIEYLLELLYESTQLPNDTDKLLFSLDNAGKARHDL